jgi:uncharacterized protein YyaL (SSP411 family)
MNQHFVCIKVDREERPDIDHIYMEAVQAMGLNGGWPLNVFLTPDQKPFYGGTYFPARNWSHLLLQISEAFKQRRSEINSSADDLSKHLATTDLQRFSREPEQANFDGANLDTMFDILASRYDKKWGGIEKAPKFVMPTVWQWLLRYSAFTNKEVHREQAGAMVTHTLKQMALAGLYDQIGGGFSRYSVDGEWFAPHFEKMLYDNAQLLSLYSEAFALTGDIFFKDIVYETTEWLQHEMKHPEGGFYSALDADSEGVEGKFYTWTTAEIRAAAPAEADAIIQYYGVTDEGNWEHGRNILKRIDTPPSSIVVEGKKKLLSTRDNRIRPGLDDKILTGWNAMTIKGLLDAYRAFDDESFLRMAITNITFLETHVMINGRIYRAFKNKHSETEGFLEDYAFIIQAYLALYQTTFEETWLAKAQQWTEYVMRNFFDKEENFFHFSSINSEKLIARKKEVFDNVIPASNSVMARNLFHAGILLDNTAWTTLAKEMTARLASMITSEPGYLSHWGILLMEITQGMAEVVIVGNEYQQKRKHLQKHFLPFTMMLGAAKSSNLSLLQGREATDNTTWIHVCFNHACKLPVQQVEEAIQQITLR